MKPKRSHFRFFTAPDCIRGSVFSCREADVAHQLRKVFRLGPGDCIYILDNSGSEYLVEIESIDDKLVNGRVLSVENDEKINHSIHLYFPLIKPSRVEFMLEKATELGVARLTPLLLDHAVSRGNIPFDRWQKIIKEASEQSRRRKMPDFSEVMSLEQAVGKASGLILAGDGDGGVGLGSINALEAVVSVFIGPEGGFSDKEKTILKEKGAVWFRVGNNVLRSETAAVVAVGMLNELLYNM